MQQYVKTDRTSVTGNNFTHLTQSIASMDNILIKILIVIASPKECATYKTFLEKFSEHPFTILEADSREQAYALYEEFQPQCVVLDYSLAEAETPELIDKLTKGAAHHPCGVVLLVPAETINPIARQLKNGVPEFLCKEHLCAEQLQQAIQDSMEAAQKNREQELQKEWFAKAGDQRSESRFQRLFECNLMPMGLWTMEGGIFAANEALLKMLGCTMQELGNRKLSSLEWTPPEYQELDQRARMEIREVGICTPYEKELVASDGRRIPVIIGGASFDGQGETGVFFAFNLTELKLARQALHDSNARYSAIVEAMPEILFTTLPDGNNDFINQLFYEYTGLSAEQARGFGWYKVVHPDDVEQVAIRWKESVETGKPFEGEFRLRSAKGEYRWFRGRAVPLRDESGKITKWLGVCMDITHQRAIEQKREDLLCRERQARALAEAANFTKDGFIALVSHELRTPLNAVLGWVNILRSQEVDKETFHQGLETIERSTKSQATLIEDLIDSAMIATGKMRIKLEKVNLERVIQSALDSVLPTAEAKAISLKFSVETNKTYVLGDASRLHQVVWNLLSNALKFTPEGGLIEVTLKIAGKNAEIIVRDTGQGINAELLPMIFERFQQTDISPTRRFGGLGLGLSLVKQLVELHGGTVHVESAGEAQGATFTVLLPLRVKTSGVLTISMLNALKKEGAKNDRPFSLSGLRVLIVDDDADAREISSIMLRQQGALVTQATSASQAYAILSSAQKEQRPEVLISDIGMPDEDGYSLMRRVRSLSPEQGGGIPAVAVTAFTSAEDRRRALDTGFQAHLSKPVDTDEFIEVIARLTNRSLHK
jgi:PAS domain S-box-containing protein